MVHEVTFCQPLQLDCGYTLPHYTLAYESWGHLNEDASNAILLCHTMTTDAHAGGDPDDSPASPGWWFRAIGPGRAFDTDRFFVVCSNVLGSCGGSSGPSTLDPASGRPYGLEFPEVTIEDMVRAQRRLQLQLGISRWHAVAGGCMGGFQALTWSVLFPEALSRVVAIGCTARTAAYSLAFFEVLRQAIYLDPAWNGGDYDPQGRPWQGLALSSALGTLFWMTPDYMETRFGRRKADSPRGSRPGFSTAPTYAMESFVQGLAQGATNRRFDPNSLLYMSRACSHFDLQPGEQVLSQAFGSARARFLLLSYETDFRYPPAQVAVLESALREAGLSVAHHALPSQFGHAAFLFDVAGFAPLVRGFLGEGFEAEGDRT